MAQSLADTLHQLIDLAPYREESQVLDAHASVEEHFAEPDVDVTDDTDDTETADD